MAGRVNLNQLFFLGLVLVVLQGWTPRTGSFYDWEDKDLTSREEGILKKAYFLLSS